MLRNLCDMDLLAVELMRLHFLWNLYGNLNECRIIEAFHIQLLLFPILLHGTLSYCFS